LEVVTRQAKIRSSDFRKTYWSTSVMITVNTRVQATTLSGRSSLKKKPSCPPMPSEVVSASTMRTIFQEKANAKRTAAKMGPRLAAPAVDLGHLLETRIGGADALVDDVHHEGRHCHR
jgi:hypothetical protein